MDNILVYQQ